MIRVHLPNGRIANFPDGTPQQRIIQALTKYRAAAEAQVGPSPDTLSEPQIASDVPSGPGIAYGPPPRRFVIEQFHNEDYIDRDEQTARLIEALQQRSGNPDARHPVHTPPPADNPGRDNFLWLKPRR